MLAQRQDNTPHVSTATLLESLPVGVAVIDRSGIIEQANLTMSRLLQSDRSLLVGQRFDLASTTEEGPFQEALESCQMLGEAELPVVYSPSGDRLALHVAALFSDPMDRLLVTATPLSGEDPGKRVAELCRELYGHARPTEQALKEVLSGTGKADRSMEHQLRAVLDPTGDRTWSPAQELNRAIRYARGPIELRLDAALPDLCAGSPRDFRIGLGALVAAHASLATVAQLHVSHDVQNAAITVTLSPSPSPEPGLELAAVAANSGIEVVLDGLNVGFVATAVPAEVEDARAEDGRRPLRALLVEDDPVSAMLARGHFDRLGVPVDLAETGRKAIQMAGKTRYDVVLLDCLLPDMNGRAVYNRLKRLPRCHRPDRILATSGMMDGQLPGGMAEVTVDAVLPKPIHAGDLEVALWGERVVKGDGALGAQDVPVMDPATIQALLEMTGGRDVVDQVLADFIHDLGKSHKVLTRALGSGDFYVIRRCAHRLKGASATVGAGRVEELCRTLERSAKSHDIAEVAPLIARLVEEAQRVEHALTDLYI